MTFAGCCIVSNFYIKSQPGRHCYGLWIVVQYPISTSNHNLCQATAKRARVVQYPISTSNHNLSTYSTILGKLYSIQFLHQITTCRAEHREAWLLYSIQFLHQITTSKSIMIRSHRLYSIQFLHQITTCSREAMANCGCIVSNFYIKSQQSHGQDFGRRVVQYPISTSNHNMLETV